MSRRRALLVAAWVVAVFGGTDVATTSVAQGGAGACLNLPDALLIYSTPEAVVVRSGRPSAYYGCLKQRGKRVFIERRTPGGLFHPPTGRFVVTLAGKGFAEVSQSACG